MNGILESLLEILYPEKNICCICKVYDDSIGNNYICNDCLSSIKRITPPVCIICGRPVSSPDDNTICRDCAIHSKNFIKARSPFRYDGSVKKNLRLLKYSNKPYLYRFFGNALVEYINSNDYTSYDVVTAVPLHKSKLRSRGYNQAKLIAKYVANYTDKPYIDTLVRTRATSKQSEQSRSLRLKNLQNAFEPKNKKSSKKIEGLIVLLIDDIYTTGATADECSKVLSEMGAAGIFVLTAAR